MVQTIRKYLYLTNEKSLYTPFGLKAYLKVHCKLHRSIIYKLKNDIIRENYILNHEIISLLCDHKVLT